jgi:hypothetical protein
MEDIQQMTYLDCVIKVGRSWLPVEINNEYGCLFE